MMHAQDLTLTQQAAAIKSGELDANELLTQTLERIAQRDPLINSTPVIFEQRSREMLASAPRGTLYGVPLTIKDMYSLPWRAPRSATSGELLPASASGAYRRLRDAGAIIVGVANQHEMGMGTTGAQSVYGAQHNPWNLEYCAGGSSGGSAAAVSAHLVAGSIGSDSGGSTRIPAAYCGVVGMKVTFGSLPYDGYFGITTSLSAPGVLARNSADARLLAEALLERTLTARSLETLRVGIVRDPYVNDCDPHVVSAFEAALTATGWQTIDIEVDHLELAGASFLSRLVSEIGRPPNPVFDQLSVASKALLLAGSLMPATYVPRGERVRAGVRDSLARVFQSVDVIAWPTTPTPAPPLSTTWLNLPSGPATVDMANVRQAALANLTGVPGISIPIGLHPTGLPIGLQLLAPWNDEGILLDAADGFERATSREFARWTAPEFAD
ncbi:MAG: amidase [Acidimicrobiaceae bacterium]|nr:amidase [Acidimicrobiaceae bacterium]